MSAEGGVFTDGNFDEVTDGTGQCRINPPQTVGYAPAASPQTYSGTYTGDAAHAAWWPITWDGHWCGQHSPRLQAVTGETE